MISQFFILSRRGDVLINRDLRQDLIKQTPEIFYREVRLNEENKPIFNIDGINYLFLEKESVYIVATNRFNSSPFLIIECLQKICEIIKDFCGELSEEMIRKNFVLIYELIDEILDFGYPQSLDTKNIEKKILSSVEQNSLFQMPSLSIFDRNTKKADQTRIPITEAKNRNEIFVDVIENIHVLFNDQALPLCSFIDGQIKMKSYLNGNPSLKINFNTDSYFDDYQFHESVDYSNFEFNKTLNVSPPKGEFNLMSFRLSREIEFPFKVYPTIMKISQFKAELQLRVVCNVSKNTQAKQIFIQYPVPDITQSVYNEFEKNQDIQVEFNDREKMVLWKIKKITGESVLQLKSKIVFSKEINLIDFRKNVGPIKMNFEINQKDKCPINIKNLQIEGTLSKNPGKWVRYITTAKSYVIRL